MTAINEALDGLQFKPEDNYDGSATLSIETNDLGHCGTGGPQTASSAIAIHVTAVNDPPVNHVPVTQTAYTQYPLTFSDADRQRHPHYRPGCRRFSRPSHSVRRSGHIDPGQHRWPGGGHGQRNRHDHDRRTPWRTSMPRWTACNSKLGTISKARLTSRSPPTTWGTAALAAPRRRPTPIAIKTTFATPPAIAAPEFSGVDEHHSLVFSQANGNAISVSDPFVGNLPVRVTLTADFGTLSLSGVKGLTFAAGSGPSGATMTFTGTLANVNAALDGMKFTPYDFAS